MNMIDCKKILEDIDEYACYLLSKCVYDLTLVTRRSEISWGDFLIWLYHAFSCEAMRYYDGPVRAYDCIDKNYYLDHCVDHFVAKDDSLRQLHDMIDPTSKFKKNKKNIEKLFKYVPRGVFLYCQYELL
jgi:hypothetical protein